MPRYINQIVRVRSSILFPLYAPTGWISLSTVFLWAMDAPTLVLALLGIFALAMWVFLLGVYLWCRRNHPDLLKPQKEIVHQWESDHD